MTAATICAWCLSGRAAAVHTVREMYFGTRKLFDYAECANCGSLTITSVPTMDEFYPKDYYSLATPPGTGAPGIRRLARLTRTRVGLSRVCPLTLAERFAALPPWMPSLRPLSVSARILDVGSGSGRLVANMRRMGFANTHGVDPFVEETTTLVTKGSLPGISGQYDLVMFHHSLEHVAQPLDSLRTAKEILTPDGRILVRLPLMGTECWRTYGTDWAALEAPRHLAIPSQRGIEAIAQRCGLRIDDWYCDATIFTLWASELYRQDIAHTEAATIKMTEAQRVKFQKLADAANARCDGDTAVFVLSPL